MAEPFIAEIRLFGFNFAPHLWAYCDGQLLPIAQNTALFSLVGTLYGGDGRVTFALPNLQGRAPMHWGDGAGLSSYVIGETASIPAVTVLTSEMPVHHHMIEAGQGGTAEQTPSPLAWLANSGPALAYTDRAPNTMMSVRAISVSGGSQPHQNMQPYLAVNACIALEGLYPARN